MREYDRYLTLLYIRKANHHAHHVQQNHSESMIISDDNLLPRMHNHEDDSRVIKVTYEEDSRLFKIPDLHDPKS